jgi:uncharacterized membrane protein
MKTPNKVLMREARKALKGKWGLGVKATLVSVLFSFVVGFIIGFIFGFWFSVFGQHTVPKSVQPIINLIEGILIGGPIAYGLSLLYLSISRNQEATLPQIFEGFGKWARYAATYLWILLFVVLWTLLLIVPGIIAAYSYSQTYFILVDDETISPRDALRKSKEMMKGNKWKLFCLGLRFIGWGLLSILTLGIGFLWLIPYARTSFAKFYEDIKQGVIATVPEEVAVA